MYGNLCLVTFCLFALVSRIHCSEGFTRDGNSYVFLFGNKPNQPSPGPYEFFQDKLKLYADSKISYSELNKFGEALDYLFKFKYFEKVYTERLSKLSENSNPSSDAVPVPDYADSETGLDFKELIVHTFPPTIKGSKPPFQHDPLHSATHYKIINEYISDNVLLTGSFYVDGNKYFFIHRMSLPKYIVEFHTVRDPENTVYEEQRLRFDSEDFVDTYDSAYFNSSEINPIVKKVVFNKVVPHALSALSSIIDDSLKYQTAKLELEFVKKYERATINSIAKAAIDYIKGIVQANGNDTFKATDIVAKVVNPDAPKDFQEKTQDIKFNGFLNYINASLVYENVSLSAGGRYYNMSQGVQFTYPQESEKKAIISCNIAKGSKVLFREFKVKSITIISEYLADLTSTSTLVYRNKEVFFNKAGFLVKLQMSDDFDDIYYKIIGHVGNEIARAIQAVVEGTSPSPTVPSEAT